MLMPVERITDQAHNVFTKRTASVKGQPVMAAMLLVNKKKQNAQQSKAHDLSTTCLQETTAKAKDATD